jgi:hypothetical protein
MYVLGTDHWTVLQLRVGPEYERLSLRMIISVVATASRRS